MVGNKQKKSSASSFFSFLKGRRPRRTGDDASYANYDDGMSARKILPFDDDKGPLVSVKPDPRIDSKASVFIANFHAARISESERQIFQQAAGNAA
ncbi:hypothetical protein NC653_030208 [Populus alba x Populus x berolinensis]|uniref:Uncharacterized protein n=1 Tax=Populus alba x Populus x berolinensis TaxID=444605 RepID=A0AAD6LWM9_9ROSI|nr:hypothetical protein NC653_030208 [Populus alba x Populus x berolinensis]